MSVNRYKKYCPNVFVAACEEQHEKGEEIKLTTKYGKENLHVVHNYLGQDRDGLYLYSITRADGFDSRERAKRKAERLGGFASNAEARSNAAFEASKEGKDFLVLGEPIKIGHHSERRHRALIERNHNRMRKCIEEQDKAERLQRRADYWESKTEEVNLSMPESVEFYEWKLEQATEHHKALKDNPKLRAHGMSLQYANRDKKEAAKNLAIAKKLWGEPEPEGPKVETKAERKDRHQQEINHFDGLFFAFGETQLREALRFHGLNLDSHEDLKKIVSIGAGGYLLKSRVPAWIEMRDRHAAELKS